MNHKQYRGGIELNFDDYIIGTWIGHGSLHIPKEEAMRLVGGPPQKLADSSSGEDSDIKIPVTCMMVVKRPASSTPDAEGRHDWLGVFRIRTDMKGDDEVAARQFCQSVIATEEEAEKHFAKQASRIVMKLSARVIFDFTPARCSGGELAERWKSNPPGTGSGKWAVKEIKGT